MFHTILRTRVLGVGYRSTCRPFHKSTLLKQKPGKDLLDISLFTKIQSSGKKQRHKGKHHQPKKPWFAKRPEDSVPIKIVNNVPAYQFPDLPFRTKDCINHLISNIITEISDNGLVRYIGDENQIIDTNIIKLLDTLDIDFDQHLLNIVGVETNEKNEKFAILKKVDKKVALDKYSEVLSAQNSLKIAQTNKRYARILERQSKSKSKEGKSLKLSWGISLTDLVNGKKNQILSAITKSSGVTIYLVPKEQINKVKFADDVDDADILKYQSKKEVSDLEVLKRQKMYESIVEILNESGVKYNLKSSGGIKASLILRVNVMKETNNKGSKEASVLNLDEMSDEDIMNIDINEVEDHRQRKSIKKRQRAIKDKVKREKKTESVVREIDPNIKLL